MSHYDGCAVAVGCSCWRRVEVPDDFDASTEEGDFGWAAHVC